MDNIKHVDGGSAEYWRERREAFALMGREPQLLGALLESGDLGFGQAKTASGGANLRHAAIPTAMMRQKWSFIPQ